MKKLKYILTGALMCFIAQFSMAQELKTEAFKVSGNCGMCKKRIEVAALKVQGVNSAEWDEETKIVKVTRSLPIFWLFKKR